MRFFSGFIVGLAVGAAAVYLAIEKPWRAGAEHAVVADAGPADAAPERKARKRRKGRRGSGQDAPPQLSARDRELVWKGEAVTMPTRSVDMAGGGDGRPLSNAEINGVVRSSSEGVMSCLESARQGAELTADITVEMLVDGNGRVEKARMRAPRFLMQNGFYACARRAVGNMRFPATGGYTITEIPYELY